MRRSMVLAALMLAMGAALPAWAADSEDCSWPEPAVTLLRTDPDRLVFACRRQAEQNDAYAQYNLGFLYETGQGVPQSSDEAMMWWRKAAAQGDAHAQLTLGLMHHMGRVALRDDAAMPGSHGSAARKGDAVARNGLGAPVVMGQGPAVVPAPGGRAPRAAVAAPQLLLASLGAADDIVDADIDRLPKWRRVRDWMTSGATAHGDPALAGWASWAASLRGLPVAARLDAINRRVNTDFRYASDPEVWGLRNYWGTPSEVVAKRATDCKGFAIMKFWLARLAGLDDGDLALLVGILPGTGQMHAVLLVGTNGTPVVLDVLHADVIDIGEFGNFRPLVAADLRGLKLFVRELTGAAQAADVGPN